MNHLRWTVCIAFCVLGAVTVGAVAGEMYRWVDKDGKVHYSEKPPAEQPATQSKIAVPATSAPPPASDPSVISPERDRQGNCLTMQCLADQMEADRLARERNYARQRQENELAGKPKVPPSGAGAPSTPAAPNSLDEKLRAQCRNGVYLGSSKVNCDDAAALRSDYSRWQEQNRDSYERSRYR